MELPIPENIKKLWDLWDLRFCILFSLFLQVCLVIFAPWRQRSRRTWLHIFLWSVYLMADWVAAVAIGLITKSQTNPFIAKGNGSIFAFWASFLLLHLGGPDSITSFSLEDNKLWIRHLFGVLLQVFGAVYSLFLTIPNNKLLIPTLIVFFVGTIKYSERTVALYLASLDNFGAIALPEPYAGHDYEAAVAIYSETRSVEAPEQIAITMAANLGNFKDYNPTSESEEMKLLLTAYSLFEDFKGLFVDFLISSNDRESSRKKFLEIESAETSFRLIEYELSLIYQLLHTKVSVVCSRFGLVVRFLSLWSMVVACISFHYLVDKHKLKKFELIVTYVFLIGAIVVDIISGVNLIFSDMFLIDLHQQSWKNHIPG
ncbi:uncharacterized protein LOC132800533 [Ziziphus jujuba]|uniref:Uncharacterized protein LOC132800533 n=1 Tax=Ziziphus jujuba TaxID=326968 RepID=A0ABM4A137_ZIZJJ|nr:uncharacterized protein LOC132800533 [Ziziphus jujuba]